MRTFFLFWTALITGSAMAQAPNGPRADAFRGLILNQTSAEDGIRMLGQPAGDKTDRLDLSKISKWLDPKHKREDIPTTLLQERRRFFADSIIVSRKQTGNDRVDIQEERRAREGQQYLWRRVRNGRRARGSIGFAE